MTVRVCATPEDTAALLLTVLGPERAAAELLAAAVHREVTLGDAEVAGVELGIPPRDLAIWIDPIGEGVRGGGERAGRGPPPHQGRAPCAAAERDAAAPADSTNEYIGGREDVAPLDGIAPGGLRSALVLIGAYDRRTGCPVLGVINEPFFRRDPQTRRYRRRGGVGGGGARPHPGDSPLPQVARWQGGGVGGCSKLRVLVPRRWQGRYHWGVAHGATRLSSLSPPSPRPAPCVVLSRAEGGAVRGALQPLCGDRLRFAAGAGYKMLCVLLGLADAYVVSEGSTFAWDACAPHAILRALGGGVVALEGALRARRRGDPGPPPELVYNRPLEGAAGAQRWANRGGLVAYAHPRHLEAVLAALATAPGL